LILEDNVKKKLIIEAVKAEDILLLKPLFQELLDSLEDTEGFSPEVAIANCKRMLDQPACCMLIERDGQEIVGFIAFSIRNTILHPAMSGLIDELVVAEKSRGKGIGKALIRAAAVICKEKGCCELEVSTEKSNSSARKFYKACGFDEDAVLLEKDLD